jgi:hypothetical protein
MSNHNADDRLQDISPRDVPCRIAISVIAVPAREALERTLVWSVTFLAATAFRAFSGRVRRIHSCQCDTVPHAFVRHEFPELMERPTVVLCSLTALDLDSFTDAAQFLELDSATCALGGLYDSKADLVVHVPAEPCLFVRKAFQVALGGGGTAGLQCSSELGNADSSCFNIRAAVRVAVRVGGELNNSEVNAKESFGVGHGWIVKLAPDMDVPRTTFAFDKLATLNAFGGSQQVALVVPDTHGSFDATVHSGQTDNLALEINAHDALIVINTRGFEPACQLTLAFPNSSQCANGEVCTQSVSFSDLGVEAFLQLELVPDIRRSRALQHVVAGIRELVHRLEEALGFTRTGFKFASHAQEAHIAYESITQMRFSQARVRDAAVLANRMRLRRTPFLPGLKNRGIQESIL